MIIEVRTFNVETMLLSNLPYSYFANCLKMSFIALFTRVQDHMLHFVVMSL